jgi:hypothetical protein
MRPVDPLNPTATLEPPLPELPPPAAQHPAALPQHILTCTIAPPQLIDLTPPFVAFTLTEARALRTISLDAWRHPTALHLHLHATWDAPPAPQP